VAEAAYVRRHYPVLTCKVFPDRLVCVGDVLPFEGAERYRIKVDYRYGDIPRVRILKPLIEADSRIHTYGDGTLCLYDGRKEPWQRTYHLYDRIIPWVAEWLVFYEIFRLTGRWIGKEAQHSGQKTRQG